MKNVSFAQCLIAATTLIMAGHPAQAGDWTDQAIAPVVNPIFFESPLIQNEVRPIFAYHRLDKAFLGADVDVRVYAVQLRYAVNDRLALIATKDGYIEIEPKGGPTVHGFADLAAGLKYAVYKNDEQQAVVTPGFTVTVPTGNKKVFQGTGSGEFNPFISAEKGWDKFHATANVGGVIPFDFDKSTANLHSSLMLDYYTCQWFIPFASVNTFTTLSEAQAVPFTSEGFDLINFGSSNAGGRTQVAVGVGFRSRLLANLDLGFGYERGVAPSHDIFKDRFTVDLIWRF